MTKFTDWCEENNYDPEGVFIVDETHHRFQAGERLLLEYDDGSGAPLFIAEGQSDGWYCKLRRLTQPLFPTPPFKLSCGDNPAVRKWLKENGCKWTTDEDLETLSTDQAFLNVHEDFKVTWGGSRNIFNYPELTINIKPASVESWILAEQEPEQSSEKTALQEQAAKLQSELDEMNKRIAEMN